MWLDLYRRWKPSAMSRRKYSKIILRGFCVLLAWLIFRCVFQEEYTNPKNVAIKPNVLKNHTSSSNRHERWIVVTSIFEPTKQLRTLSRIPGWKVVVVGDKKSPHNWALENVIFLDTTAQLELGYNVLKFLPWNSYTRKIIGYLYALENGAKYIYDTDDDNEPHEPATFENNYVFSNMMRGIITRSRESVENPYAHFGQRSVWPRGYPLERISQPPNKTYTMCQMPTPLIQQGLVNGDPDVDAIFRLTRRFASLNIEFDNKAPPMIYPPSVFAPYNSQNTLFHYDAFWSLVLPISVAFRVTDIWRGYWAQPLLWKIGGRLGFYPPYTTQVRNAHVYLMDFAEEDALYKQSGDLISLLSSWECSRSHLYTCMLELTEAMVTQGMWANTEMDLIGAWISDLKKIGYNEPNFQKDSPCLPDALRSTVLFNGVNKMVAPDNHRSELREFCEIKAKKTVPAPTFPSTLLIVTFNLQKHYENIWLLDLLYRPHYPNMLYCGEIRDMNMLNDLIASKVFIDAGIQDFTFIRATNITRGNMMYECVLRAIDMKFSGITGYLSVSDDILLNFWNTPNLNLNEMWIQGQVKYRNTEIPLELHDPYISQDKTWDTEYEPVLKALAQVRGSKNLIIAEFVKNLEEAGVNSSLIGNAMSDMFYVPVAKQEIYYEVGLLVWKHQMFLEMATPLLAEGLGNSQNLVHLNGESVWGKDRDQPLHAFNVSDIFLHPLKLSRVFSSSEFKKEYCQKYIARVLELPDTKLN